MNRRCQMQGGKNLILPKEINENRFFRDSHWLEIWKNHSCPTMGPNGGSVAMGHENRLITCLFLEMRFQINTQQKTSSRPPLQYDSLYITFNSDDLKRCMDLTYTLYTKKLFLNVQIYNGEKPGSSQARSISGNHECRSLLQNLLL
jgi:hypothetical protein